MATPQIQFIESVYEPLIVTRSCTRCQDKLQVEIQVDEDRELDGALFDNGWRYIGGELLCGRCVEEMESEE